MFYNARKIDPVVPSVNYVLQFLQMLHDNGLRYSAINTAKSAITSNCTLNDVVRNK